MSAVMLAQAIKQVKAAARSVVVRNADIVSGAQQVHGSIRLLPLEHQFPHPAINALLQAIPATLPSGESRLYISDEALVVADDAIAEVVRIHRVKVLLECKQIYFACSQLQQQGSERSGRENSR